MSGRTRQRHGGPVTGFNARLFDPFAVLAVVGVTAEPGPDLSWQDAAACQYTDPEIFHPEKGGSVKPAKKVCASCPVSAECLEYALETDQAFGVWGGKSEPERRRIIRDRARSGEAPARTCSRGWHVMTPENTSDSGTCLACPGHDRYREAA